MIALMEDLHMAHVAVGLVLVTVWLAALGAGLVMLALERCCPRLLRALVPGRGLDLGAANDGFGSGASAAGTTEPDQEGHGPILSGWSTAG